MFDSSLLADRPSWLDSSIGPFNRNEIGQSWVLMSSSNELAISASSSGFCSECTRVGLDGGRYHEADSSKTTSQLTRTSLVWGFVK